MLLRFRSRAAGCTIRVSAIVTRIIETARCPRGNIPITYCPLRAGAPAGARSEQNQETAVRRATTSWPDPDPYFMNIVKITQRSWLTGEAPGIGGSSGRRTGLAGGVRPRRSRRAVRWWPPGETDAGTATCTTVQAASAPRRRPSTVFVTGLERSLGWSQAPRQPLRAGQGPRPAGSWLA